MGATKEPQRGELAFIRRLQTELSSARHADTVPFGDDMAALLPGDGTLLGTTDMLTDGVDFESHRHSWYDIGRKAMAVNLSDCAAMAARPLGALCAVTLHEDLTIDDALALARGVRDCGARFECPLVGGDTNSWSHPTAICITIVGEPEPGRRPVRRDGACSGDRIFVTGRVGGSILGRHMDPQPRIATALAINRTLDPHAMIDISDGLAVDLAHVLDASHQGAEIDERALRAVIHPDAERLAQQDGGTAIEHALHDGEDFELLVVLPADVKPAACEHLGLLPLGRVIDGDELVLLTTDGKRRPIERRGWEHFR